MKKKILGIALILGIVSTIGVSAATGTDRTWSVSLPHNNGNAYFALRNKETNETKGNIKATSLPKQGINAWINTGSERSPIKITDIASVTTTNVVYDLRYQSNYSSGTVVFLGVENKESTSLFNGKAAGTVNYK